MNSMKDVLNIQSDLHKICQDTLVDNHHIHYKKQREVYVISTKNHFSQEFFADLDNMDFVIDCVFYDTLSDQLCCTVRY